MLQTLKSWARQLKQHSLTVYCVARHPETPVMVRVLALLVAAYALSPIDLIPDFIPVIGYLDDLIIVPLGLWLVIRLTPKNVIDEARQQAVQLAEKPVSYTAAIIFVLIWLLVLYIAIPWVYGFWPFSIHNK